MPVKLDRFQVEVICCDTQFLPAAEQARPCAERLTIQVGLRCSSPGVPASLTELCASRRSPQPESGHSVFLRPPIKKRVPFTTAWLESKKNRTTAKTTDPRMAQPPLNTENRPAADAVRTTNPCHR